MKIKKNLFRTTMYLLVVGVLLFSSCEEDTDSSSVTLTADAGNDVTVDVGQQVNLDGSNSDINSGTLTYLWEFTSKPGGSNVQIQNAASVSASFTPDVAGDYVVNLEVSDGNGEVDQDEKNVSALSDVVEISEDITTDQTWTEGTLYRVTNYISINSGAKLTIEPGVTVEFAEDAGLKVSSDNSVLVAAGTQDKPVILTGQQEIRGYWRGVFIGSSSVDNIMEHVDISYGGSTNMATYFDKTNMVIDLAKITLRNVSFTGSAGYGIQTRRDGSTFSIENSEFNNNANSDMLIHPTQVDFVDNLTNFNGGEVEVYGGDTEDSGSETWSNLNNGNFYLSGSVTIDNNVSIEAGALFEMGTNVKLKVSGGYIKANGTSSDRIVFSGKSKAKGAWAGILIASSSVKNEMDYVKIEYGGGTDLDIYMDAGNIGVYNDAYISLTNALIENSANYGTIVRESRDAVMEMSNVNYSGIDNDNHYIY